MECFLGTIILWPGMRIPSGWALCDGKILQVAQYSALFSLIGNTYGGNGSTTFALPDLRGRAPIGTGAGPNLTPRTLGNFSGTEMVTLTGANLPVHHHTATVAGGGSTANVSITPQACKAAGTTSDATNNYVANAHYPGGPTDSGNDSVPAATCSTFIDRTGAGSNLVNMAPLTGSVTVPAPTITIGDTGQSAPSSVMQPFLALNYIIALEGIYPSYD